MNIFTYQIVSELSHDLRRFGTFLSFDVACSSFVKRMSNNSLAYAHMSLAGICKRLIPLS